MTPAPWWTNSRLIGGALVAAVAAIYANALGTPFHFDDEAAILLNPTIRDLARLDLVLAPPVDGSAVTARPLVNLSLAINYAIGGYDVRGFHAFNVVLHALAALVLFDLVRRTLARSDAPPAGPAIIGGAVALLWAVHPLLTESVTCVVQRTESLAGLFYLVTLYAFVRSVAVAPPLRWQIASVVACLAGMATKEIMVTAPVIVLLFDRAFVAGKFSEAWRQRRGYYLALAATWLLLAFLVFSSGAQRGGTVGFGLGPTAWRYLLTQAEAITHYLRLAFWPDALVFDYGTHLVTSPREVVLAGSIVLALLITTAVACRVRPRLGFLGCWFFLILAPSSSVLPLVTQTIAEHRMYLPLASLIALVVVAGWRLAGTRAVWAVPAVAVALGWTTVERNRTYASAVDLWTDTIAKRPDNARAHGFLGTSLVRAGREAESLGPLRTAARLAPERPEHHQNLAIALDRAGHDAEAIAAYQTILARDPGNTLVRVRLGHVLRDTGRRDEAQREFHQALLAAPDLADAHAGLGDVLGDLARWTEAVEHFRRATRARPDDADLQFALGNALAETGGYPEALAAFRAAVTLQPSHAAARNNLGNTLLYLRRPQEAVAAFRELLAIAPNDSLAHANLGQALVITGDFSGAITHFERALTLDPENNLARSGLATVRARQSVRPAQIPAPR